MLLAQKRNGKNARRAVFRQCAAAALAGALAAPSARALHPDPPWRRPDRPRRAVVAPPPAAGAAFLVAVPGAEWAEGEGFDAHGPSGRPAGARLVHRDERFVWLLVGREPSGERRPFEIYFGGPPADAPPDVRDPDPVQLENWRPVGGNAPDSWPRMAYMFSISSPLREPFRMPGFERLDRLPPEGRFPRGDRGEQRRRQPVLLSRLSSWALLPAGGRVRFVLDSEDCAFLLVNGRLAASAPHGSPESGWVEGEPVELAAGVHRLEVYVASRGLSPLRVGWFPPGASAPEAFGSDRLLSGARAEQVRIERADRTLQADFEAAPEAAYGFVESHEFFQPVRFDNRSVNWLTDNRAVRWRFDGGRGAEGDTVRHVFPRRGPWRAAMEIRDALGFVAAIEREVDPPIAVPRLYALRAFLERLPPVAFPGDRLDPGLRIEGESPAGAQFDAEWVWTRRDGETSAESASFSSRQLPLVFPLGRFRAADAETLTWQVRHEGATLFSETIRFGIAPAGALRVEGDGLYAGGERFVLRPDDRERRPGQRRLALDDLFGNVLFADDFLSAAGRAPLDRDEAWYRRLARLLDGPDRPRVRWMHPPRADREPEAWAPLLKFAMSPSAAMREPTLIAISIGLGDLLSGMDAETYERHAAALTDALMAATPAPVAWLTPPPYPGRVEAARAYAAAIRRVARARGTPVADLFTAFVGAGAANAPERFFEAGGLGLTSEGRELAAQVAARAWLQAAGENPP